MSITSTEEYLDALITVDNTKRAIYVSEETTRAIVADCWERLEASLELIQAAYSATADEPHERVLTLLTALTNAAEYADVIYVLTPMPEDDDGE